MKSPNPKKKKNKINNYIRYTSMASEMLVIMGAPVFLGYKIDQWFSMSFHLFTLIFLILGFFGALLHAIKKFLK